ncbi:MAG: hypothetical protein JSV69_13965 [Chloroflexota bacterium]|nr:MAG: hypothetical protein JSV69_13965 [Chloroflexota bacterium]UCF29322.1 MAG: hypothetical protein JSW42_06510 [Chloroflexota bacterium]
MESEVIKTNLLAIAVSGFLTMLAGITLYFFRGSISTNIRYLLQIPPLGVAAYIFAFNLFRYYDGNLPDNIAITAKEIVVSTLISGGVFLIFTISFVVIIGIIGKLG